MSLGQTFDVSRVTNLENRLTADEAIMVTTNDTSKQVIPYLQVTGATNSLTQLVDPATNGAWFGIMQDSTYYNLALGRFVTGSKAIEMRSYFDNLTFRTGRSATATSADINFITNDQVVAGISANMNLMPRGVINLSPNNGGVNTAGLQVNLASNGEPQIQSLKTTISDVVLIFGSASLVIKNVAQTAYQQVFASAFNVSSDVSFKEDIIDYDLTALDQIKATKVKKYKLKEDPTNADRIGLIRQEAPPQLQTGEDSLDIYQMCSMLWKAVQELSDKVEALTHGSNNAG